MSNQWLSVVGIGDDGLSGISPIALNLLEQAEIIVGGRRHLAMLPPTAEQTQLPWQTSFSKSIDQIIGLRGQRVCVLASGDPMCYGVGEVLQQAFRTEGLTPMNEMTIIPVPSAFSIACSRLGWPHHGIETVSLCGRDPHLINALIYPGAKILALSADHNTPEQVATILYQRGAGAVTMAVLEHLGGAKEQIISYLVKDWATGDVAEKPAALNTIALTCPDDLFGHSRLPGLADELYLHDGQLTKRAIRAVTLSSLAPCPGQLLWDVGAGNGSIAIEWLRSHPRNQAMAIEQHSQRLQNIMANAAALGVPNLQVIAGQAPHILTDLPDPDAIFIGGGLTTPGVFAACWEALKPGGTLVVNSVTVETEQWILRLQQEYGGTLDRLAVQKAEPVGKFLGWKALAPVTQWIVNKPIVVFV
jgi:precorrin-6B C5,15-methyltransferase / cobalt-precorrin-6B C5,C15-methyltransferase